jgi:hypothetical protein
MNLQDRRLAVSTLADAGLHQPIVDVQALTKRFAPTNAAAGGAWTTTSGLGLWIRNARRKLTTARVREVVALDSRVDGPFGHRRLPAHLPRRRLWRDLFRGALQPDVLGAGSPGQRVDLRFWLRGVGYLLPQTYALAAIRSALLPGDAPLWSNVAILAGFAVVTLAVGIRLLRQAIRTAEAEGGIGVVV